MMWFMTASGLLAALAVAVLTAPLWRRDAAVAAQAESLAPLRQQQRQLHDLHASGALDDESFRLARERLERRALDAVFAAEPGPSAARPPAAQRRLALGVSFAVLAVAGAGYAWMGTPQALREDTQAPMAAASTGPGAAHSVAPEQMQAMVEKLAARLAEQPDDADGWTMLGRSYLVLGRHAQAAEALGRALERRSDDAVLLADAADATAMANGRTFDGEPARLVVRALKADPDHPKALSLAGSIAFDQADYAAALRHWEHLQRVAPNSELARQMQGGIDEARLRLGGAAPPLPSPAASAAARDIAVAPAAARVSGTVTLAGTLAAQAQPDDTLFVFARAAEGPRMPLAILRKQVRDLPLAFTLDDSLAMSPAARLSSAPRVVVGARISRSGGATPQPGDLQGSSAAVATGASQLKIEIAEVVR